MLIDPDGDSGTEREREMSVAEKIELVVSIIVNFWPFWLVLAIGVHAS